METKRTPENNENTHLQLILEELILNQSSQIKSIKDLTTAINSLSDRFINFEEQLNKSNPVDVSTNIQPVQELIKKNFAELKLLVSLQQQKPQINKTQLLLFPEQDAKLFYKIVFGRWFLWLTIMLLLTNLYKFGIHYSDNQKENMMQLLENDRIKRSWNFMYLNGSRGIKKLMDSTYHKITNN